MMASPSMLRQGLSYFLLRRLIARTRVPKVTRPIPIPRGRTQSAVSVLGSSPPVTVVSSGVGVTSGDWVSSAGVSDSVGVAVGETVGDAVGDAVGVVVGEAVGVAVGDADGVAVSVGVGVAVSDAVSVGVGVTVMQASLVMVLLSRVTAPFSASSWPLKTAPVVAVIEVFAST